MKRFCLTLATLVGVTTLATLPAMADLVFAGQYVVGGSGFGALPRALTVQSHGPATNTESGCIAPGPGNSLISGSGACVTGSTGGDEQPPISFPKQATPSLNDLGIQYAGALGILFDGVQPQSANNPTVTINDLTLKLYSGTTLLGTAVLTPEPLVLATNPGNGATDYLFRLNAAEAAAFDALIAGNYAAVFALDATISFPNQSAGPDSFAFVNLPEPGSLGLVAACCLAGLMMRRRALKRA